ncbi:MAG TPA: diguanylate cyclase [Anaerolineaceae bacterium]|nr:diguanylate cyclase [Anaerolineaceae bacterium]
MDKFQVLIIDDDKDIATWFKTVLVMMGFEVDIALSARQALTWLASSVPDLILLDLRLGQELGGEDILYQIRSNSRFDYTRVIIITGYPTSADMVTNLADLVMIKPVELTQLKTLVNRMATSKVEPKSLSFRDPVTMLFNKEFFQTRLELAFERSKRRPEFYFVVTIFQLEVRGMEEGQLVPDATAAILYEIAERLKQKLRPTDTITRISGFKFATLHEDLRQKEDTSVILDRLAQILGEPVQIGRDVYHVSASFGYITDGHNQYKNAGQLFEAAEQALQKTLSAIE